MNKVIEILHKIFAPTVTKTYYYNNKKVGEMPKEAKEAMQEMEKTMERMKDIFKDL